MTQKDDIIQELRDLASPLADAGRANTYQAPDGYFDELPGLLLRRAKAMDAETAAEELKHLSPTVSDLSKRTLYLAPQGYFEGLAEQVLRRVKASEATTASDEINALSPLLSDISRETPYTVPAGYFEELADVALSASTGSHSVEEELKELSPLLSGLKKENLYSVPDDYFENAGQLNDTKIIPQAKVVPMTRQRWFRYAAAAIVTGLIVTSGFFFFKKPLDPEKQSFAWVKKNMKNVDEQAIDSFVKMAGGEEGMLASADISAKVANDVKELIKDISDVDMQRFLDEVGGSVEEESIDELFMN